MSTSYDNSNEALGSSASHPADSAKSVTYWRVEGSLLELGALRPVLFFTWNSRSYAERWARRAGMAGMALVRAVSYAGSRPVATRVFAKLVGRGGQRRLGP